MKKPARRKHKIGRKLKTAGVQYTIRRVPLELDKALREQAQRQKISMNQAALVALRSGLGENRKKKRDFGDVIGPLEPEVLTSLEQCRQIDWDAWK